MAAIFLMRVAPIALSANPMDCFERRSHEDHAVSNVCPGLYEIVQNTNRTECAHLCLAHEKCKHWATYKAEDSTDCRWSWADVCKHHGNYDGFIRKPGCTVERRR